MFSIQKNYDSDHLKQIFKQEKLCDTVGGNPCYVLTITDNVTDDDIKITDESFLPQKRDEESGQVLSGFQLAAKN